MYMFSVSIYKLVFAICLIQVIEFCTVVQNKMYGQTITITIYATGNPGTYNSGSVTSTGLKNDCNLTNVNSINTRGWASFVMPNIPPSSTINSAEINFTTYSSTASSLNNNLYGFGGSASGMSGTTLYNACLSGTSFNTSPWIANASQTKSLNAAGLNFIATNLTAGNIINIGFVRGSNLAYNIEGYCSSNPPSLVITYTLPCFPAGGFVPCNTLSNKNPICLSSSFTVSVQNSIILVGSGYTAQWQWSSDSVVWNNILGANSVNHTSTWNFAEAFRYYRLKLFCYSNEWYSTPLKLIRETNFMNCYCAAGANINGCNTIGREYISEVKFNTIHNTSTCPTSNSYTNFSGISTTISQGANILTSVKVPNSFTSDNVRIWIDFNHNSSFADSGEEFDLWNGISSDLEIHSGIITIPITALTGPTKMRVRLTYGTPTTCGTSIYGEVEDYNLNIIGTSIPIQLKVLFESYLGNNPLMDKVLYNQDVENNISSNYTDVVEIQLREDLPNYPLVGTYSSLVLRNGIINARFPSSLSGKNCYLVVKHRNSIETWSANPITIPVAMAPTLFYDFTSAANMAYGSNQVEIQPGIFALYSGELNSDENIDLLDFGLLETDIDAFSSGYLSTDINGDGNVDLLDASPVEMNLNNFIFSSHP